MNTLKDNLSEMARDIQVLLVELLMRHSTICDRDLNSGSAVVLTVHGDKTYKKLGVEGQRIQSRVLDAYKHFCALIKILLQDQTRSTIDEFSKLDEIVMNTIEQRVTWCVNVRDALNKAVEAIQNQLGLLDTLSDESKGLPVYVPDTNALLYNPALEKWEFPEAPRFVITLLPTILSELDSLKVNHRNDAVKQKAEKLIRQIKEYRRRGNLNQGVSLVTGKIELSTIATEPNFANTLPWLDKTNNDDRFLAAVMEVMKKRIDSPVLIVSLDINLQNKAGFAAIPYVEPPTI